MTVTEWIRAHMEEVRAWAPVAGADDKCLVASCNRSEHTGDLCRAHYRRAQRASRALARASGGTKTSDD